MKRQRDGEWSPNSPPEASNSPRMLPRDRKPTFPMSKSQSTIFPLPLAPNRSHLPTPVFPDDSPRLNRKRARSEGRKNGFSTPRFLFQAPPQSPVKSAPPKSRIFRSSAYNGPRSVGASGDEDLLKSPHYSCEVKETYFDQCFIVEEKIGVGSFGEVYKVQAKEDGKYYAVKKTRQGYRGDLDRSQKIQEACQHERLTSHPNCVHFYKAWEEMGHLYIQTELCHQSLKEYEEQFQGPLDEDFVWSCFADLAMGLKHIHDINLGHFDIKPDNIFVTKDKVCKIGDFGLMLDLSKNNVHEAQDGDPKYLAPELLQNQFDKSADVFSLGMTLLELSCDIDLPNSGQAWHVLRSGHIPDSLTQDLSADLRQLIRTMLNPDPAARPTIGQVLQYPHLAKVASWRRKSQARSCVLSFVQKLKTFLASILFFLIGSLLELSVKRQRTPTPHENHRQHTASVSSQQTNSEDELPPPPPREESFQPQLSSSFTQSTPSSHYRRFPLDGSSVPTPLPRTPIVPESPLFSQFRSATTPAYSRSSLRQSDCQKTPSVIQRMSFDDSDQNSMEPKNLLSAFEDDSE